MDKDTLIKYAPIIVVIFATFVQYNLFVTPAQLEIKHREILMDVADRYATKEQHNELTEQLRNMQQKIDKIYDIVTKR